MPTLDSSFNGVIFAIYFSPSYSIPQTPKWVDRNEQVPRGSVQVSINGRPALQEMQRLWKPVTLEFRGANLPPALMTEAMLAAFNTAIGGGVKQLRLESMVKNVIIDWRIANPVQYTEVTPTGEGDVFLNQAAPILPGRLYEGVIHFLELL